MIFVPYYIPSTEIHTGIATESKIMTSFLGSDLGDFQVQWYYTDARLKNCWGSGQTGNMSKANLSDLR